MADKSGAKATTIIRSRAGASTYLKKLGRRGWWLSVEYFLNEQQRWTDRAWLSYNKAKSKLYLDYTEATSSTTTRARQPAKKRNCSVGPNELQQRIKFHLNSTLQVVHSSNISSNFQIVLRNSHDSMQFRIAFYSELDIQTFLAFVTKYRVQEVLYDQKNVPTVNEQQQQLSANTIQSAKMQDKSIHVPRLFRRKSTGSSDTTIKSRRRRTALMLEQSFFFRRHSSTIHAKMQRASTVWYDDEEENEAGQQAPPAVASHHDIRGCLGAEPLNKMSHNSLESEELTITSSSSDCDDDVARFSMEDLGSVRGVSAKFAFRSTPTLSHSPGMGARPQAPMSPNAKPKINPKLEKYKFLLINIEQDPDIVDLGAMGADPNFGYFGLEFDDYPDETVDSASFVQQPEQSESGSGQLVPRRHSWQSELTTACTMTMCHYDCKKTACALPTLLYRRTMSLMNLSDEQIFCSCGMRPTLSLD